MGRREVKGIMRQNKEKKTISPIIVFLAFLLGVAVAVFAVVWRKRSSKDKKTAGASDRAADRNRAQMERKPEAQKVRPYRPRKRVSAKRIFGRAVAVAVAAALVLTGLYLAPYNRITAPTVQAKERQSFGGIKQVVQDHEEDPFVILNIVPKKAVSKDGKFEISLGTIGYLAPGQSPIQQDLTRIFKGEGKESLYPYSERKKLTDLVINSGLGEIKYQEAYVGIDGTEAELGKNGWTKIFDTLKVEPNENDCPTGRLWASVTEKQEGQNGNGFDYEAVYLGSSLLRSSLMSSREDVYQFADNQGNWKVIFEPYPLEDDSEPSDKPVGYRFDVLRNGTPADVLTWGEGYSDTTGLYLLDAEENVFYYADMTLGDIRKKEQGESDLTPTDPTPTDPTPTDPTLTDPIPTDPTPTDPTLTDPIPTDSTPTDPTPTDPIPNPETNPTDAAPDSVVSAFRPQSAMRLAGAAAGWHLYVNADTMVLDSDPTLPESTPETESDLEEPKPDPEEPKPDPEEPKPEPEEPKPDPEEPKPEPEEPKPEPEEPKPEPEEPKPEAEDPNPNQEPTTDPDPTSEPDSETVYYILQFIYDDTEQEEQRYRVKDVIPFPEAVQPEEELHNDTYVLGRSLPQNGLFATDGANASVSDNEPPLEGTFRYVGSNKGQYKITRVKEDTAAVTDIDLQDSEVQTDAQEMQELIELEADNGHYIEVQNAPVYMCVSTEAKDWLRQYVFNSLKSQDNASDDFAIKVNTVFAADVTYEMVQEADLVYLEDGEGLTLGGENDDTWVNKYIKPEDRSGDSSEAEDEDGLGDISDVVITRLLYRAVEESMPVIVDYAITESQDYPDGCAQTKYQKLAKAFLKKDLTAFYQEMAKKDDLAANILMNADKDSKEFPNKTDNNNHYVNRNVYIVNGEKRLVDDDFHDPMPKTAVTAGFNEVLAAIRSENVMISDDEKISENVSKAMAVQYIINYSLGLVGEYKDLSILELQPTANINTDLHRVAPEGKERVVLYWQRKDQSGEGQQILRSSKRIKTDVTTSSVAAFNSSYQDINAEYNMIFIGLDGQRLNRERDKEGELSTVYNNTALNGKVYHTGDDVAGGGKYDANDITEQKKEALLDYLRAGYPIVVENECFKGKSAKKAEEKDINTKYIADNTQMYAFLKEAISMGRSNQSEEYGENGVGIYTIEDVHSSVLFMMQLNTMRPKVELRVVDENGEEISGEEQENSDMIATEAVPEMPGICRGSFEYRIASDRMGEDKSYMGSLNRHLYFDLNYDGVFAEEEELTEYEYEENEGLCKISVDFNEIDFGIVPWKLEVADTNNEFRRAATQGCFTINSGNNAKIRVLQVLDDTTNAYANFQEQYDNVKNSMLAYYLKRAEAHLKMSWKIETVTPNELAERLSKNANYLSRWDVVVLGFGESGNPGDAVTTAVNDYVAAGGSIVVSSAGASADKGRLGLSETVLGQMRDDQTYGRLGLYSGSKYRYEGISAQMFYKTPGLLVDRINDGTITRWPYPINMRTQLGDATEVSMPDYLLDIGTTKEAGQAYTTAWFTLLDSNLSSDGSKTGGYSVSPRDGRNNYYVYSKGNVVYVGQSQYPYAYDAGSDKEQEDNISKEPEGAGVDECQIFVNALVAAYNAGIHRANVSIVAGFNGVNKVESVTVPFDVAFKEGGDTNRGILGDTVDVYFRFTDNNIATDKKTTCSFYYKNPGVSEDSELLLADDAINTAEFTEFTSPIWSVEDNRLVEVSSEIVPGKVYRIKAPIVAPLESLQAGNDTSSQMSQICVLLKNSYRRAGQDVEALSMDSVTLNRAQMFLLE